MKLFNLIIYNQTPEYDKMRDELRIYLKDIRSSIKERKEKTEISKYPNIECFTYYFIALDENIPLGEYKIVDDDTIFFGGAKDNFVPGCLLKTIMAFIAVHNSGVEYDYMVRSNISTVINFDKLVKGITDLNNSSNKKHDYLSGYMLQIKWIDLNFGVTEKYDGIKYASGTNIILSQKAVNLMVHNKDKIEYNVVDDVAFGIFMRDFNGNLQNNFADIPNSFVVNNNTCDDKHIFYRNRDTDRTKDVNNISKIIECIMKIDKKE
jgi:hypothetical protein